MLTKRNTTNLTQQITIKYDNVILIKFNFWHIYVK